uniref:Uncharacterized protein n=1 Tax=Parascaris univalens TaxID=6257 RepID=A0A915BK86_PARUN
MIHSSRFLAIYVLLAALIYVHALECYDYHIRRGANGYSQQSTRPVKCPKSEYCIQLFGMLRTGPNNLRYVREQTCEKSKYVSAAVCKESGCFKTNFRDVDVIDIPVEYCCCNSDLCNRS